MSDETRNAPVKLSRPVLGRIAALILNYPGLALLAVVLSVATTVATLTLPKLLGRAIDQANSLLAGAGHSPEEVRVALLVSAALVIVATIARGVLGGLSGYVGEDLSQRVAYDLRLKLFDKLQRLSFGFHDRIHSGDLITRGMLDLEGAQALIHGSILPSLNLVLLIGFATWLMAAADPALAVIGLSFVPVAGVVLARMGFMLRMTWLRVQELMGALTLIMEENLQGVRVVRAFVGKTFELAKFDRASEAVVIQQFRRIALRMRGVSWMMLSFHTSLGLLLWVGSGKVSAGEITVGQLTEFLTYMTLLQAPIRQISMVFNSMARATSSGERLFEILDLEPEIVDAPDALPLRAGEGVLRFENVDFSYAPGAAPVLRDVSFEVRPGRTLGVVGPPGSGKSTLANLIPRFYDVGGGRITLDGVDIRTVTLQSLRQHVGVIQQEAFLFDASVGHNIAYADPWAEDQRLEWAASTAQLHDFIVTLPEGYETRVGERGVSLSGGQRQRMSIARGVTHGPRVMIFDDSTTALDAATEKAVRGALAEATRNNATIVISHRLSSLMHADEILVLDEGRIVERGTHAQLVAAGGAYAALHRLQSREAVAEAPEKVVA